LNAVLTEAMYGNAGRTVSMKPSWRLHSCRPAVIACFFFLFSFSILCDALGGIVYDIDFGSATNQVARDGVGKINGVLPDDFAENYTGWCDGIATTEVKSEEGIGKYLRLTTSAQTKGGTQFVVPKELKPGCYRFTVESRTLGAVTYRCSFRMGGSPYSDCLSRHVMSENWSVQSWCFSVPKDWKQLPMLFVNTRPGVVDLKRMKVETATIAEMAQEAVRRPSKDVTEYIRHNRFPLGLPTGWCFRRDCEGTVYGADETEPAPDGVPVLKVSGNRTWAFYSEVFQTAFPGGEMEVSFKYRSDCRVRNFVNDDHWRGEMFGESWLGPTKEWKEHRFRFRGPELAEAFTIGWGTGVEAGTMWLDDVRVRPMDGTGVRDTRPCLQMAVVEGDAGEGTRVQFLDEKPLVKWCVVDVPTGSVMKVEAADLYGEEVTIAEIPLKGGKLEKGTLEISAFKDCPMGQFRICATIEKDGKVVSEREEIVLTRVVRPVMWGKDAPNSPFASHFNPWRPVVKMMKACGVNWVRFHDAAEDLSNWFYLERKKGEWTFRDAAIDEYRRANVKIFAQLGMSPEWANHSADLVKENPKWTPGYFGRYLRPTNSVDWVNYVTTFAKHYRGVIDEYFVWNEPGGHSWQFNDDAKWFAPGRAGQDFAVLQRQTYDALKAVDPKLKLFGFNAGGPKEWVEDVMDGGGFDCCDGIDWHYYSVPSLAHRETANVMEKYSLPSIRAKYPDFGGKPLYMSEGQGTNDGGSKLRCHNTGLYHATVPWTPDTMQDYLELSDNTARFLVQLLADGFKKVFLYTCHGYVHPARRSEFSVLIGKDGYPVPSFVAHAALAQTIEGKTFVNKEDFGEKGCVFTFRAKDGKNARVYSDLSEKEKLALAKKTCLHDVFGNPVTEKTAMPDTLVYEPGK